MLRSFLFTEINASEGCNRESERDLDESRKLSRIEFGVLDYAVHSTLNTCLLKYIRLLKYMCDGR
jgi:hypothetical protein